MIGAGNIGVDPTPYVDGEIVREGAAGDHGDGAFSTGVSNSFPLRLSPASASFDFQSFASAHDTDDV